MMWTTRVWVKDLVLVCCLMFGFMLHDHETRVSVNIPAIAPKQHATNQHWCSLGTLYGPSRCFGVLTLSSYCFVLHSATITENTYIYGSNVESYFFGGGSCVSCKDTVSKDWWRRAYTGNSYVVYIVCRHLKTSFYFGFWWGKGCLLNLPQVILYHMSTALIHCVYGSKSNVWGESLGLGAGWASCWKGMCINVEIWIWVCVPSRCVSFVYLKGGRPWGSV